MGIFSNIVHKSNVRVANLEQIADGLKEHNRRRIFQNLTADDTYVICWVAPYNGRVEDLWISSDTATTSDSSNHVTVTINDLTISTVLLSFDTYTNSTELLQNQGTEITVGGAISPSTGLPFTTFNQGDVLEIKVAVTGAPGPTSSSKMAALIGVSSTDKKFAV